MARLWRSRRSSSDAEHDRMWIALTTADPTFADRFEADAKRRQEIDSALAPVVEDLIRSGVRLEFFDDLKGPNAPIEEASPVLARWLPLVDQPEAKRQMIQVLGNRRAGIVACHALVSEFLRVAADDDVDPMISTRSSVGSSLSVHDCAPIADQLLAIAADPSHGAHRAMMVSNLAGLVDRRPDAIAVLRAQLTDPDVRAIAAEALGRMKATEARHDLEQLLDDSNPSLRATAKAAISRL